MEYPGFSRRYERKLYECLDRYEYKTLAGESLGELELEDALNLLRAYKEASGRTERQLQMRFPSLFMLI